MYDISNSDPTPCDAARPRLEIGDTTSEQPRCSRGLQLAGSIQRHRGAICRGPWAILAAESMPTSARGPPVCEAPLARARSPAFSPSARPTTAARPRPAARATCPPRQEGAILSDTPHPLLPPRRGVRDLSPRAGPTDTNKRARPPTPRLVLSDSGRGAGAGAIAAPLGVETGRREGRR